MLVYEFSCCKLGFIVADTEVVKDSFHIVLHSQTYVQQAVLFFFKLPLFQSDVVEVLDILIDEERDNAISKALFQHQKPAYTAVSVVEGVYLFKSGMELSDVIQVERRLAFVFAEQVLYKTGYIFRQGGLYLADLIRVLLIIAYNSVICIILHNAVLQHTVELLYIVLSYRLIDGVEDVVEASEVICSLKYIIHRNSTVDSACLIDLSGLVMCKSAAFDVVGVVSKINLHPVIYAALDLSALLRKQNRQ